MIDRCKHKKSSSLKKLAFPATMFKSSSLEVRGVSLPFMATVFNQLFLVPGCEGVLDYGSDHGHSEGKSAKNIMCNRPDRMIQLISALTIL